MYRNTSLSVSEPDVKLAVRLTGPVSSSRRGAPSTKTGLLKFTVIASAAPIAYVPLSLSDETDRTEGAVCTRMPEAPSESDKPGSGSANRARLPAASSIAALPPVFSDMWSV